MTESEIKKNFATNVRFLRKKSRMTRTVLAEKLGRINPHNISLYESGDSMPRIGKFIGICQIFDVTPNDLLLRDLTKTKMLGFTTEIDQAVRLLEASPIDFSAIIDRVKGF